MNPSSLSPLDSTVWIFSDFFFSFKMLSEFNSDEKNQRECSGETCLSVHSVETGSRESHVCRSSSGWELLLDHALGYDLADLVASLVPLPAYQKGQKCSQGVCAEAPFKSPEREVYEGRGKRKGETIEHEEKQQVSRRGEQEGNDEREDDEEVEKRLSGKYMFSSLLLIWCLTLNI